jgi:hypothetical protein
VKTLLWGTLDATYKKHNKNKFCGIKEPSGGYGLDVCTLLIQIKDAPMPQNILS